MIGAVGSLDHSHPVSPPACTLNSDTWTPNCRPQSVIQGRRSASSVHVVSIASIPSVVNASGVGFGSISGIAGHLGHIGLRRTGENGGENPLPSLFTGLSPTLIVIAASWISRMHLAVLIISLFMLVAIMKVYDCPPCMKCGRRFTHADDCEWKKYLDQRFK